MEKKEKAEQEGRTVHLALVREDDFAATTWRVDGQRLLEALLDIRAPHALCIVLQRLVQSFTQLLTGAPWRGRRYPLCRQGGGCGGFQETSDGGVVHKVGAEDST